MATIFECPAAIMLMVFNLLSFDDFKTVRGVCKEWNTLSRNEVLNGNHIITITEINCYYYTDILSVFFGVKIKMEFVLLEQLWMYRPKIYEVVYNKPLISGNDIKSLKESYSIIFSKYQFQLNAHDFIDGKHKITSSTGAVYEGTFVAGDLREGEINDEDGNVLKGTFERGQLIEGIINKRSGVSYKGKFTNNQLYGPGRIIQADGYVFEGCFKRNLLQGTGKLIFPNGNITVVYGDVDT
jgi:hypothetical protein